MGRKESNQTKQTNKQNREMGRDTCSKICVGFFSTTELPLLFQYVLSRTLFIAEYSQSRFNSCLHFTWILNRAHRFHKKTHFLHTYTVRCLYVLRYNSRIAPSGPSRNSCVSFLSIVRTKVESHCNSHGVFD